MQEKSQFLGKLSQLWDKGSNSMCLRISQVLDRNGNTSGWTKVETKVSFQNKPTFAQRCLNNEQEFKNKLSFGHWMQQSPVFQENPIWTKLFRIDPVQDFLRRAVATYVYQIQ